MEDSQRITLPFPGSSMTITLISENPWLIALLIIVWLIVCIVYFLVLKEKKD